jgi:uncharacterized protein YbjT (DUF2867 family)
VIAVTGASGYVGGRVARSLASRGVGVRAIVRDPARAPEGPDVRVASGYGAASEMRAALQGASTLFLVPAEESVDRVSQHKAAVDGVIAGPAGEGRAAVVARDDVASVVVSLLSSDGHDGATDDVTGREALSMAEAASILSARYVDETLAEARASRSGYGAPDWQVEAWISTYTAIASGALERVTDVVERFTDRPPSTLAEYVREHSL